MQHLTRTKSIDPRQFGWAILAFGVAAIVLATLAPAGDQATETVFSCIFCGDRALADVLVNIGLYVPLGIALTLIGLRPRRAILAGTMLSAVIEVIQVALPGRDSSVGDVLSNAGGAALGALLVVTAPFWLHPSKRVTGWLALGWSLVIVGIWALSGWLLQPSFPESTYWGQWTPNLGHLEWYRGRVLGAMLGGREIRSERAPDSETLRRDLLDGEPMVIRFVAGPRTARLAPIFSIYDREQREIVLIGVDRDDLVFRYRTRAGSAWLDQPDLRRLGVAAGFRPGDTLSVRVQRSSVGWKIGIDSGPVESRGHTIGRGWATVYFTESFPDWLGSVLDSAWVFGLLLPLGYLVGRDSASTAALTVCIAGAALIPPRSGMTATSVPLWVAMVFGALTGASVRRRRQTAPDRVASTA